MLSEPLVKLNSVYVKVQEALLHLRGDLLVGDTGVVGKAVGGTARIFDAPAFYAQQARQILRKFGTDAHMFVPGVGYLNGFAAGNYLESTGNTNAAVDGAVGLVLDAAGSVGPELVVAASSWGLLGDGGTNIVVNTGTSSVTFNGSEAAFSGFSFTSSVAVGKTYKATFTISSRVAGQVQLQCGGFSSPFVNANGSYSYIFNTSGTLNATIKTDSNIFNGVVSGLSIREVTGTHATQTTTANKPTLRRGIVNLLEYSAKIDDGAWWPSTNLSLSPTTVDGLPAVKMTPTTTNGVHRLSRGKPIQNGGKYTAAVVVKAAGYNYFGLKSGVGGADMPVFNLATGAIVQGSGTIADLGGGRYLCCHTFTGNADQLWISYWTTLATGDFSAESFAGDGVSGTYIFSGGLFQGTLTAQQIIAAGGIPLTTTAPASSSAGAYAWQFDGVDDRLECGVPFQASDDFVILAAARTETAASYPFVFCLTDGAGSTSHAGLLFSQGKPVIELRGAGGFVAPPNGTLAVQRACVMTGKKVGNNLALRVDGVQVGTSATTAAGVVATFTKASIGARLYSAVDLPLNGQVFAAIAIKGTVSDADLRTLEKWLGSIAGVAVA